MDFYFNIKTTDFCFNQISEAGFLKENCFRVRVFVDTNALLLIFFNDSTLNISDRVVNRFENLIRGNFFEKANFTQK
jgi:hypothetical protein